MNRLAQRLVAARAAGELINYYIEHEYVYLVLPRRRLDQNDRAEQINGVSIETMRRAVRQAGIDVAANVLTIWS